MLALLVKRICKEYMENNKPDPEKLLEAALTAPKYPELSPYFKVVMALRQRDLSWRNMADWFARQGVKVSHTTLRDFYKDEVMTRPEPVMDQLWDEINDKSEGMMLSGNPFDEEDNNEA